MNDLMVDIETLGTRYDSVITQIGACYFDRYTGEVLDNKFLINVHIQDCLNHGLTVDGGAIKFWFEQEHKTFLKEPVSLTSALQAFRVFCHINRKASVWSHATFDMVILANAYRQTQQGMAVPYRQMRDIRTLVDLAGLPYNVPKEEKIHDALDDCLRQVRYCVECFKELKRESTGSDSTKS